MVGNKLVETSLNLAVTPEFLSRRIFLVRGQKVMVDNDLAELYQVPTKVMNQAVKRNKERFPIDFMFRLNAEEMSGINRSQYVTGSQRHRDPRYRAYAFTELGVAMLSFVLRSDRAVQMNIFIMRAFVQLRELIATNKEVAARMDMLEQRQDAQGKHLVAISTVLKKLADEPVRPKGKMGFVC